MQYIKIKDAIVEQIESGTLLPRQKLPSERQLAEAFDTTRITLREALSLLEAESCIFREDRRGWFISPQPLRYDPTLNRSFSNVAVAQNRTPKTEVVLAKCLLATKSAVKLLELAPFSEVCQIDRVLYLEDRPVAYVTSFVRSGLFPNLLDFDLSHSLADIYHHHFGMSYGSVHYRVGMASLIGDVAQSLRATSGASAMLIEKKHYNLQGDLIDAHLEYWRHDAISIESATDFNCE
ncbi:phosphonate utilization transcriptional regulator PhnR [Vibrio sp. 10N.286.49.B3]|uniref:UTRA domain-containing protein n=1 Tax=Vibrio sp. 10N.286.49.B3 TaxID=1880855 RepID=UPI000C82D62C|nr:UTRA domain-containing protein [Vibrio sp. 10N.286.49.B3]PMH40860.1 phosphonate utilization transcriptional regulator PhnR [Vibrio sp. 10N.286.49.B3]